MSVVITREDLKSYAEVDYIIKHMNERYTSKLPENLIAFFDTIKDPNHEIYLNPYKPLNEQGLSKYALEIIALLHIKYWCENKERKEELLEKMRANQEKFESQLREKYGANNIFSNLQETEDDEDTITTAFSKYTENNPDIHDYTDVIQKDSEFHQDLVNTLEEKTSLFTKIKKVVLKIFGKL